MVFLFSCCFSRQGSPFHLLTRLPSCAHSHLVYLISIYLFFTCLSTSCSHSLAVLVRVNLFFICSRTCSPSHIVVLISIHHFLHLLIDIKISFSSCSRWHSYLFFFSQNTSESTSLHFTIILIVTHRLHPPLHNNTINQSRILNTRTIIIKRTIRERRSNGVRTCQVLRT